MTTPKSLDKCDTFGCFETATMTDAKGNHYCSKHAPSVDPAPMTEISSEVREVKIRLLKKQIEYNKNRYAALIREANQISEKIEKVDMQIAALEAGSKGGK